MKIIRAKANRFIQIAGVYVKARIRRGCKHCAERDIEYAIHSDRDIDIQTDVPDPGRRAAPC